MYSSKGKQQVQGKSITALQHCLVRTYLGCGLFYAVIQDYCGLILLTSEEAIGYYYNAAADQLAVRMFRQHVCIYVVKGNLWPLPRWVVWRFGRSVGHAISRGSEEHVQKKTEFVCCLL